MPKEHEYKQGDKLKVNGVFPVTYVEKSGFLHAVKYQDGKIRKVHPKWLKS